MKKANLISIYKFRQDIQKKGPMNAVMGFWFGFFYNRYAHEEISYTDAVEQIQRLREYTGA